MRFATPALATEVQSVEVALVRSCAALSLGEAPASAEQRVILTRADASPRLSAVDPGRYGLTAVGRDGSCAIVAAAACVERDLERTGSGELVVELAAFAGVDPMCACQDGRCLASDGGVDAGRRVDAGGSDAGGSDAGGSDAGTDGGGPCSLCAACADCVANSCQAVESRCDIDEYCDIRNDCTRGIECVGDPDCEDDNDTCSTERCDLARAAPVCVVDYAPDDTACTSLGGPGVCRAGRCCNGC